MIGLSKICCIYLNHGDQIHKGYQNCLLLSTSYCIVFWDKIYTNTQYINQYIKKVIIFLGYAKISIIFLGMPGILGIFLG